METELIEQQDAVEESPLTIPDILAADNLVDMLDAKTLDEIASKTRFEFDIDEKSRSDWLTAYRRWLDLAMQVRQAKTFPWANASNIKVPLLTTAAVQFQARAYPAIVDGANLVKGRVLGPDPDGTKRQRADTVADHMSWQLLFKMDGWEEDTDQLLLMLPILGCVFRKTYHDPVLKRNVSEMVPAEDFVVNYWAKSLNTTPRYTHVLRLYPHEVRERVLSGLWADPGNLTPASGDKADQSDPDTFSEFLEQHRLIDLDNDGYPEPYVVTIARDGGKPVRIVPCFDAEGVTVRVTGKGPEVVRIERRQYFTKYPFIPSPDGSFYDIGFGKLLDDLSATIDTTVNQMLDAGTLQNAQGGFIGAGVNLRSGAIRMAAGEWKKLDVTGGTLKDNIVPLNLPGPSPVLFTLLELMLEFAKGITSVQDIMTGDAGGTNQAVGTTLARIEQGLKVFTAIYKRIHRAFGQELRILFTLNRDYLDEQEWFALTDTPGQVGRADYQDKDMDVVPVSDPNNVADMVRITRADALLAHFNGDPLINQKKLRQVAVSAYGIPAPDREELLNVPPPPPDPKILIDGMQKQLERMGLEIDRINALSGASQKYADAATKLATLGLIPDAATLAAKAVEESQEEEINEPLGEQGGVPGMEGAPADAGVPSVPGGLGGPVEGPMGDGGAVGPGGPAAGGADGAIVGTDL